MRVKLKRMSKATGESEQDEKKAGVIDTPSLDDGGKKPPAKFSGGFVLPEDLKGPGVKISEKETLPADALVVSPLWMAESVITGKKKLLVLTHSLDLAGKAFVIVNQRMAYGVAEFGEMQELDGEAFRKLEMEHLISDDLRNQWCQQEQEWCSAPYYAWPITKARAFDEARGTNVPSGQQALVRDVVLKQIRPDPTHLFVCARLPDKLKERYTALAKQVATEKKLEVAEEVDHVSLLYIPSTGDVSDEQAALARSVAAGVIEGTGAIEAKIHGWGFFDGASKGGEARTALVALIDAPGLAEMHVALKVALTAVGFAADDQTHGFVPHTTIAYLPRGARVGELPELNDSFTIESVEFVHSDIRSLTLKADYQTKAFEIEPDADPEHATTTELLEAHVALHLKYRLEAKGKGDPDFSTEDVVNLHALIVDEMRGRGMVHPPPPDDGLDDTSEDFERTEPVKKSYARVLSSGDKLGRPIHLAEVLDHFQTFKLRKPYIYLVGGLANNGVTEGDIDILVKDSPDLPEAFKHALHFRLGRALPGELAERLSIHYDNFHGPFTSFVELFDLVFERVNPQEVKQMRMQIEKDYPRPGDDQEEVLDEREKAYSDVASELWEGEDKDVSTDEDGEV